MVTGPRGAAECNSAIQQIANLRYEDGDTDCIDAPLVVANSCTKEVVWWHGTLQNAQW
jgi:hypothetical protein